MNLRKYNSYFLVIYCSSFLTPFIVFVFEVNCREMLHQPDCAILCTMTKVLLFYSILFYCSISLFFFSCTCCICSWYITLFYSALVFRPAVVQWPFRCHLTITSNSNESLLLLTLSLKHICIHTHIVHTHTLTE